jgi:hypothetical protein
MYKFISFNTKIPQRYPNNSLVDVGQVLAQDVTQAPELSVALVGQAEAKRLTRNHGVPAHTTQHSTHDQYSTRHADWKHGNMAVSTGQGSRAHNHGVPGQHTAA